LKNPQVELYVMFPVELPEHLEDYLKETYGHLEHPVTMNFLGKDHPKMLSFLNRNGYTAHPMMMKVVPEKEKIPHPF
jgi:hypothetical protein